MSNLIFGATKAKFLIVWIGTIALAAILFFVKRNKPDHYLEHLGEFRRTPGILSAGSPILSIALTFFLNPKIKI